jgi:hypothetical protein
MARQETSSVSTQKNEQLCVYSLAINNSTNIIYIVQFGAFIWGVNEGFLSVKELLELVHMKRRTGGDKIFSELLTIFSKYALPWGKNGCMC